MAPGELWSLTDRQIVVAMSQRWTVKPLTGVAREPTP